MRAVRPLLGARMADGDRGLGGDEDGRCGEDANLRRQRTSSFHDRMGAIFGLKLSAATVCGNVRRGDAKVMKEVTKEKFKEVYFALGGGAATGWGLEIWNSSFENEKIPGMKYFLEEPETSEHTRMMIVTDYGMHEHRLFFFTEESEESLFEFPDDDASNKKQQK